MKKQPIDFRVWVDELRALGNSRPNRERREIAEFALNCPYEGVQSVAAQTLGKWNDVSSTKALREFWPKCVARKNGWSICGVVDRALANCVQASDAEWVLEAYFNSENSTRKPYAALHALPLDSVRPRLELKSRSSNRHARRAAFEVMSRMPFPDRRKIIQRFLETETEDQHIHRVAMFLMKPIPGEK